MDESTRGSPEQQKEGALQEILDEFVPNRRAVKTRLRSLGDFLRIINRICDQPGNGWLGFRSG